MKEASLIPQPYDAVRQENRPTIIVVKLPQLLDGAVKITQCKTSKLKGYVFYDYYSQETGYNLFAAGDGLHEINQMVGLLKILPGLREG